MADTCAQPTMWGLLSFSVCHYFQNLVEKLADAEKARFSGDVCLKVTPTSCMLVETFFMLGLISAQKL